MRAIVSNRRFECCVWTELNVLSRTVHAFSGMTWTQYEYRIRTLLRCCLAVLTMLCVNVERLRNALSRQAQDEKHSDSRNEVDAEPGHIP